MAVGGDDDTLASSMPTSMDAGRASDSTLGQGSELVAGRYRIVRWLGGGGMGRVYEALDTELDEKIALKVLRSGLTDDALERFRREVKLTRRILHRNVARMFDIGEHNGEKFLTMELVDGDSLTRELGDKPMSWTRLEPIAMQLCEGLAAAHEAGVIHRDLKPDNVLIERATNRVVLTDFGIARGSDDPSVTQVGAVVGTPRYMSPEQLNGRDIDARSDLFALGVMLFELATGLRPWPGDNAIAIAVSQATTSARKLDTGSSPIPAYFAAIVTSCIQLDPGDRPPSAAAIAQALATQQPIVSSRDNATRAAKPTKPPERRTPVPQLPATPAVEEPTSLAVLPLSCAPDDEYLADGVAEDLTDTLSTTPGLRVRPAGVIRSTGADPRELGSRLQVDHVVVGSVRRTPDGLRIATRLVSVADGFQIWAHKTDCAENEVLTIAGDLARGIADALSTRATAATKPTDPRAVDFYLRARAELRRFWGSHAQTAADLLEQAVEYAPTSAPILAAYAYAAVQAWVMRGEPDLMPRAEAAVERALGTGHGEAHLASAQFRFQRIQLEQGAADLAHALLRAPMSGQTHELAGKILIEIEGSQQARHHYETARGLDPGRSQIIENDLARLDALEGKWADTDRRLERLMNDPDSSLAQLGQIGQARLAGWRGRTEIMNETARASLSRVSGNAGGIMKLVSSLTETAELDREQFDNALLIAAPPNAPQRQFLMRLQIVTEIALNLGYIEGAMNALERAVDLGLIDVTWMDHCPLMEKVVEHPRFLRARRIVGERAARVLAAFRGNVTNA